MMDKLMEEVQSCAANEYNRASKKYGPLNHSSHESYSILLEEYEEARDEVDVVNEELQKFWELVKRDELSSETYDHLVKLKRSALLGACELIQVAAMATKAVLTMNNLDVSSI